MSSHPYQSQHQHLPPISISDQPNYPPRQNHPVQSPTNSNGSDFDAPSLPRYSSPAPQHGHPPPRNNNPYPQQAPLTGPRPFVHNSGPPHPLSHATYADSNPTLNETDVSIEKRFGDGHSSTMNSSSLGLGLHSGVHQPEKFINPNHSPRLSPSAAHSNSSQLSLSARSAVAYPPEYGMMTKIYRAWNGNSIGDSGVDERHSKKKRLPYIDALKFFAAIAVMNGTLFDAVLSENDYKVIQRDSPLYIFRSTNLGICMLLLLSGRSLIAPLWDAANPHAKLLMKHQDPLKPLISWARLTRAMLIRPFRFILPVLAIAALQWGLASGGDNRATKNCNNAGMNEPYWANIDRFAGYVTLVFNLFTYFEQDTIAGKAFGANLWVTPWFFQSSYAVYVTHFMLGNLPSNRYWVYGILMFFSWTSLNYFALPITGLFIADMAAHGQTARLRKLSVPLRIAIRVALLVVAAVTQFIPVVRNNLNSALATVNVQAHTDITFSDWIFVTIVLFIVETSDVAQRVLGFGLFKFLGQLSAGIFLLAPAVVFTIVPDVALSLHNSQTYSAPTVLGLSWALLLGVCFAGSIAFHLVVECPSKLIGEVVCDLFERLGADKEQMKKDAEDLKALTTGGGRK
ncbi:uncharacterized protein MELLADRAFT_76238 [Melampsora larici-populina 98AG31]|uniref:Acyltransferase 3 domain-containing protein n=1 Tax=Melampsora larici-populina (strain 98AG31 / pathotype 3-4-7) TaxID=747676 RepID=F4R3C5_MELLP|nr:uncharacterized protein MELLADRAFT_76238 [Melampsora larici-populina 98AG31]EGG12604.1 hypothetical protein MELLADRAFT_76238 [Melampsora larici-populina 98AG31]